MKTVSIIIPIYNTGASLVKCLDSVMVQTVTDWECLMIDDGSTDDSPALIDSYASRDERFVAIHKKNGGVSSARNVGLDRADGDWIVFLDSDDALKPNHIEAMLYAVDKEIDIVFTGFEQKECGQIINSHTYTDNIYINKEGIASFLDNTDVLQYMIPWDRMYRRSIICDYGVRFDENLSLSEDRLFCYNYLLHTRGVVTIAERTYIHDVSDSNSLSYRFYPFHVNAYKYDTFVEATRNLIELYPFSIHVIFLLWRYTWGILYLTLDSLYDVKGNNIFQASRKQADFYRTHSDWKIFDMIKDTSELNAFVEADKNFQLIRQKKFLRWNLKKVKRFIKCRLHISR